MVGRLESRSLRLLGGRRNLTGLEIRDLAFRPQCDPLAGEHLKKTTLELGGKSPQILFEDADLERALPVLVGAIVQNGGQTCSAGSRALIQRPLFDPDELERERRVILEEIRMVLDTPDERIYDLFLEQFWPRHALGRPIQGTAETVGRMSRRRLRSFFRSAYRPGNVVIAAAGNLDAKDLEPGEVLRVDTGCIVAFQPHVSYDIQFVGGVEYTPRPQWRFTAETYYTDLDQVGIDGSDVTV